MSNTDPLEKLIVSESQAVDRQELADLLLPYLSINKETLSFDFTAEFRKLSNADKILIILSAAKAKNLILSSEEKIKPSEIIKMDIAPEGSIKNTLKTLLGTKEIKADSGKYYLPNYKLAQLISRLKIIK